MTGRTPSPRKEAYIALINAFATRWPDATEPPITELAKVALDVLMPKETPDES